MSNVAKTLVRTTAVLVGLTAFAACSATAQAQAPDPAATTGMSTKAVVAVPEDLVGKNVVALDGTTVGEVSAVRTDGNGELSAIEADVGGFLGIGETTITIQASDFMVSDDMVVLAKTEAEVNRMAK